METSIAPSPNACPTFKRLPSLPNAPRHSPLTVLMTAHHAGDERHDTALAIERFRNDRLNYFQQRIRPPEFSCSELVGASAPARLQ
jgi:hypothetical protein